jgi:hypothetical protein
MSRSITIIRESRVGVDGLMLESMGMRQLYEAVSSDEESKKGFMGKLWEKFRDSSLVDLGLDMLGLFGGGLAKFFDIPTGGMAEIVAMIPDLINAFRRFARGDKFGGALSLICAIPFAGDAAAVFIQGEKAAAGGGKATLSFIKALSEWAGPHRGTIKTIQTGTGKIADVVADHLPGMEKHHDDIVAAVGTLTSGDKKKMLQLAKESGMKIAAREAGIELDDDTVAKATKRPKPPKGDTLPAEELDESTIRRSRSSRKIVDLYEGTLY